MKWDISFPRKLATMAVAAAAAAATPVTLAATRPLTISDEKGAV